MTTYEERIAEIVRVLNKGHRDPTKNGGDPNAIKIAESRNFADPLDRPAYKYKVVKRFRPATEKDAEKWLDRGFTLGNPDPNRDIHRWVAGTVRFVEDAIELMKLGMEPEDASRRVPLMNNATIGQLLELGEIDPTTAKGLLAHVDGLGMEVKEPIGKFPVHRASDNPFPVFGMGAERYRSNPVPATPGRSGPDSGSSLT